MSIDTYFCFCCLSTNELSCLYSSDATINYASLLQSLFNISICLEDYEYDSYICDDCAQSLNGIQKFKTQVFETLNILQNNGLIEILNENEQFQIKKATQNLIVTEEKHNIEDTAKSLILLEDEIKDIIQIPNPIEKEDCPIKEENSNQILSESYTALERKDAPTKEDKKRTIKQVTQYNVPNDFKCNICGSVMPNAYTYHSHMNQHYPNHICETCGKGFLTEKRLKRHIPSHKRGPFKCQDCGAEFTNYNTLNSHRQRKHSTLEMYKCPHCPERFGTYTRRAVHLAAEHQFSTRKYVCKICNRGFLISGNLSGHMRRAHAVARPHACAECGAAFPQRRELLAHGAAHRPSKPFHCQLCPNKYPRKKALVVHMRTHTNERRFACEVCGKRFLQKCTLLVHAKTHNRKEETCHNVGTVETEAVEYTFVKWTEVNKK